MRHPASAVAAGALWLASVVWAAAFDLQGHRGARGLAPENTLPAFIKALSVGVTTLELDVGMTKDGVLVVAHDPGSIRTSPGSTAPFSRAPGPRSGS